MSVLVTGANGYLGRHLLAAMYEANVQAAALVRRPQEWPRAWRSEMGDVPLIEGSPLAPEPWLEQAKRESVHTIIHTAGIVRHTRAAPEEMIAVNVESTLSSVRAAAAIKARVVFISSSGTVGCYEHAGIEADEHAPFADKVSGRWPYYASKIRAEKEGAALAEKLGVTFTVVRLPVLLGPRDHKRRSTGHVARVLEHRVPFVPSGGMHFTDVRDVSAALVRLTQLDKPRGIYHFPGTTSSLGEFFDMVSEVSGVSVTKRQASKILLKSVAQVTEGMTSRWGWHAPHWLPDPVVLEMAAAHWGLRTLWTTRELAYVPRAPRQTLSDTVSWLREQAAAIGEHHASHHPS